MMIFQTILWYFVWPFFHVLFRFRVKGADNIPKKGGVILCANHVRAVDCIYIPAAIRRRTRFMAKEELFKSRPLALLIRSLGAFPVNRTAAADLSVYKKVVSILKKGEVILIFAQGHRMKELDAEDAKAGVALFALKTNTPVVPVAIVTKYTIFSKLSVNVGKPVDLSEFAGEKLRSEILDRATKKIMDEVVCLVEEIS
ncbi:MAG: 1-acyl-sn-glycerol-3-phosphate acyltransferase [Defluviitaleaceae bacterium]|nr:1-acyl-sn-glycerol-3-phosphate acyltransferase [Defluviitaleaceae bacterium]